MVAGASATAARSPCMSTKRSRSARTAAPGCATGRQVTACLGSDGSIVAAARGERRHSSGGRGVWASALP